MTQGKANLADELKGRLQFESLISDLSARFVGITSDKIDKEILRALKIIRVFFKGDRCGIVKIYPERKFTQIAYTSYGRGVRRVPEDVNLYEFFPWQHKIVIEKKVPIILSSPNDLPPEAVLDRQSLEAMGIRSLVSIPVFVGGKINCALLFQNMRHEVIWSNIFLQRIQLLAEILVNALIRKDADQALRKSEEELASRLKFERMLSGLSARFVALDANQIDNAIEDAQKTIVEALDLDRSVLFQITGQGDGTIITHSWSRPQWGKVPRLTGKIEYPWAYQRLISGDIMVFSRLAELPPEAFQDKESHKRFGAKSSLAIPLSAGGRFFGALTFTTLSKERDWLPDLINRLRLVSEVFTNALARKRAEEQNRDRLHEIQALKEQLEKDNVYLRSEVKLLHEHGEIVGESKAIQQVLIKAEQVAPTESTVLILGETGTGKELLAREIHAMSRRGARPLVTVNCASLPPSLIESELFGREKGAYTGALSRMTGRFETAEGSTLFLDEIGELPYEVQGKLLRVLENGTFERLGSTKTIKIDVRIISATNCDLAHEVKEGRFRKDLFYRLNVFPITIPPLRERTEDIPALVWTFVRQIENRMGKRIENIPQKSIDALGNYPWPGNVRELKNVIEHAMIISRKNLEITPPSFSDDDDLYGDTLEDVERKYILRVLERTRWRIAGKSGASEILGVKRTTLYAMLKNLGIQRPSD